MAKKCTDCKNTAPQAIFYGTSRRCITCQKTFMAAYRARNKSEALFAYGGPHPTCACPGCQEDRLPFLTIDHVNCGGNQHRALLANNFKSGGKVSPGGGAFYRWLKKNGYPSGYRILCYNCNMSRSTGPCPVHET